MVIMDTTESKSSGNLEELALKRKERLKNLKRKIPSGQNTSEGQVDVIVPLPKPKFRSYKPQDESLREAKLEDAEPAAVEDEVKDLLEAGKEKQKRLALKKEEVLHLLNLISSNPIVFSRTTNASTNKLKGTAWANITKQFNAVINTFPRTPEQLRLKWENLKKNARRRNSTNISNIQNFKNRFGIPDYVHPDEVLDKVTSILESSCEGSMLCSDGGDLSAEETDDLSTVVLIPLPSDEEETTGSFNFVEVGVSGEACASGRNSNIPKESEHKRSFAHRTSGLSVHQNLMATEVESRIYRNNAIAEYYITKKKKIVEEIVLNKEILLLQKKKVELELLELQNKNGSIIDMDRLLLEKNQVELEILEMKRRKYSAAASLFRSASEGI